MAQNYKSEGKVFEYLIPASTTIDSGDLVKMGSIIGVALAGGTTGVVIPVAVEGIWSVPKATDALTIGEALYYDATAGNLTATSTSNTLAGYASSPAASGDATVEVKLFL